MPKAMQKRLLFDWQIPGFIDPVWLDVPAYLAAIDRIRPDAILLMAKSAFGCTYYDDAYGHHNEGLAQDLFADLVGPLQARGIEVIAYLNVTLNDVVAKRHPEWHQVTWEGEPAVAFTYQQLCMNSPYRDLLMNMMADLVTKYPLDGLWFDITYVQPRGCFCAYCREQFEAQTGVPLSPAVGDDPRTNALFHAFRRDTRRRFVRDAAERVRAIRPGLSIGWNHAGDPAFSEPETDAYADLSSMEFHPPAFARGGRHARAMRAQGRPFELIMPESLASWGDWTVAAPQTLRAMVAIVAAHGGSPTINHVPWPSGDLGGHLAGAVVDVVAQAFRYYEERLPLCEGAQSVPVGALLHSVEDWRARLDREGLLNRPRDATWLDGAADLLADNNVHFDILDERMLDRLGQYEFLVLPETETVSEGTAQAVREYVRGGGRLLALGAVSPILDDVLGVQRLGECPYTTAYLGVDDAALAEDLPDMPLLVRGAPYSDALVRPPVRKSLHCQPVPGAHSLGVLIEPVLEPDVASGYHIYHAHPPAANRTPYAGVVHHAYGAGQVVFMPMPVPSAYAGSHSPWLRRLVANALDLLGAPRALRVWGPAGMETVYTRQGARHILHLVPRRTESPESTQVAADALIQGVRVRARVPGATSVTLEPAGVTVPFRKAGEDVEFDVPGFGEWVSIVIA